MLAHSHHHDFMYHRIIKLKPLVIHLIELSHQLKVTPLPNCKGGIDSFILRVGLQGTQHNTHTTPHRPTVCYVCGRPSSLVFSVNKEGSSLASQPGKELLSH